MGFIYSVLGPKCGRLITITEIILESIFNLSNEALSLEYLVKSI